MSEDYLENRDLYFDSREPNAAINPRLVPATTVNVKNTSMPKSCLDNTLNKNKWVRWNPIILEMLSYLKSITIREPPSVTVLPESGIIYYGGYGVIYPNGGWVSYEIDSNFDLHVRGGSRPVALIIEGSPDGRTVKGRSSGSKFVRCPAPDIRNTIIGPFAENKTCSYSSSRWGSAYSCTYTHRPLANGGRIMISRQMFDSWGTVTFANNNPKSSYGNKKYFTGKPFMGKFTHSRGSGKIHTPTTIWWHYALIGDPLY